MAIGIGVPFVFRKGGSGGGGACPSLTVAVSDTTPTAGDTLTITATPLKFTPSNYIFYKLKGSVATFIAEQSSNVFNWTVTEVGSFDIYVVAEDGSSAAHNIGGTAIVATGAILDTYPAYVACSLQKLRGVYTGSAVRVRRSSDNAEQDIGFTGLDIDSTALLAFVGSGDGFATIMYDQVGSSNFTQTTTASQPKIVSSGSLITDTNGLAAMQFDGSNDFLYNAGIGGNAVLDSYRVGNTTDTQFIMYSASTARYSYTVHNGSTSATLHSSYGSPSLYVNNVLKSPSNRDQIYDEVSLGTPSVVNHLGASTTGWVNTKVGSYWATGWYYTGLAQAFIFYNVDSSANRSAITTSLTGTYVP